MRRDDQAVKLAQVTQVCHRQAVNAVVVHRGLTPHTPEGGTERQSVREERKYTEEALPARRSKSLSLH